MRQKDDAVASLSSEISDFSICKVNIVSSAVDGGRVEESAASTHKGAYALSDHHIAGWWLPNADFANELALRLRIVQKAEPAANDRLQKCLPSKHAPIETDIAGGRSNEFAIAIQRPDIAEKHRSTG